MISVFNIPSEQKPLLIAQRSEDEIRSAEEESRRRIEREEESQRREREHRPRPPVIGPHEEMDLVFMELQINNPSPHVGEPVTATVRIRNNGNHPARQVFVVFFLNGHPVGEKFVNINPRGVATAQVQIDLHAGGPQQLHVMVDSENGIPEVNEDNNFGEVFFNVSDSPEMTDQRKKEFKAIAPPEKTNLLPGSPEIYVGVPSAGSKLYVGDGVTIKWLITGYMDDKVKIQRWLHDKTGGMKVGNNIVQSTPNVAQFPWIIPTVPEGKYTIEVTTVDGKVSGESDSFWILYKKQPTIKILSPIKGTKMSEGKTYPIKWAIFGQHNPNSKASVSVSHQESGMVFTIGLTGLTTGMPAIAGPVFNWKVGNDMNGSSGLPGGKYTLEVANIDSGVSAKSGVFDILLSPAVKKTDTKTTYTTGIMIPPEDASKLKAAGTYKAEVAIQKAAFFGNYFYIDIINLGPETIPKHLVSQIGFIVDFDKLNHCEFKLDQVVFDLKPNDTVSGAPYSYDKICLAGWYPSGIKFNKAKVQMILPAEIIDGNKANNKYEAPYPTKSPWTK